MLAFWLISAAMTACVLALLVPALVRTPPREHTDVEAQNIDIARQRLDELRRARQAGEMTEDDYQAGRAELEASLAQDLGRAEARRGDEALTPSRVVVPVVVAFLVPAAAGALYLLVGEPGAIEGELHTAQVAEADRASRSIEVMMDQLKARLAETPDDTRGWSILARTSMQLQRYDDAADAYARLNELSPGNPEVLVQYADALAMRGGGVLAGQPTELLDEALRIDPDQPQGLWLAGMAAQHRGAFADAMAHWRRLLPLLDADPGAREELMGLIDNLVLEARSAGIELDAPARGEPAPATATALTVRVSLSPELVAATAPGDTVFVFARAVDGPPMPLAATRREVRELPFEVVLDDSSAMLPNMALSAFDRVNLVARISRSGQPTAASGDLEGVIADVDTGTDEALELVIARRIP